MPSMTARAIVSPGSVITGSGGSAGAERAYVLPPTERWRDKCEMQQWEHWRSNCLN